MTQHILRMTALLAFVVAASFLSAADPPPPEVAKLIGQLKATKAATRLKAVTDLGNLKEKASVATDLLANVAESDPDADVRSAARTSRAAIVIATFTIKLKDPDERVRLQAATELRKLKFRGTGAVEELTQVAVNDSDGDVRRAAQYAVDTIKEAAEKRKVVQPFFAGLQSKKPTERIEALNQMAKLGEKAQGATFAIVLAMMDGTPAIREAAASCLEKVDPKLHKLVVTTLYDKSEAEIHDAEKALGKLGARAEGALPALKYRWSASIANPSALEEDYYALEALVAIGPDDTMVVNEVLKLIAAPHKNRQTYNNRIEGLRHLDSIDAPNAKKVSALVGALTDPECRLVVVQKLERYGTDAKTALPALRSMKLDGDVKVREAAAKAVEKIGAAK